MQAVARLRANDPLLRETAHSIVANLPSYDMREEALRLGEWVLENVRYVKDADGIEQLYDPLTMLEQISRGVAQGDCDDMALLLATLLLTCGHTPSFRCVRYEGTSGAYNHIYVVDYVPGSQGEQRLALDAILKDEPIGSEVPHASGDEYPI